PHLRPRSGAGTGLTQQDIALARLGLGEPRRSPVRVVDLPGLEPRATRRAVPRLAAVRQIEPGSQRRIEHRAVLGHDDATAMWLDANAELAGGHPRARLPGTFPPAKDTRHVPQ